MVLESIEPWCKDCPPINDLIFCTSKSDLYIIQIKDSSHGNFCDVSLFKNYLTEDFKHIIGQIEGEKFLRIQNEYVLQFFNKYLRLISAPLLESYSYKYPEVIFKSNMH